MLNQEFVEAFLEMEADELIINVSLTKMQGWMLMQPIQLAYKHPEAKTSKIIKIAIKVGREIQSLVTGGSPFLTEVANAAWAGREPKTSIAKFKDEFRSLADQRILVSLSKSEIWSITAASQLAHRHPEYKGTEAARANQDILDQLSVAIPEGILSNALTLGWNPLYDMPVDKKGFG